MPGRCADARLPARLAPAQDLSEYPPMPRGTAVALRRAPTPPVRSASDPCRPRLRQARPVPQGHGRPVTTMAATRRSAPPPPRGRNFPGSMRMPPAGCRSRFVPTPSAARRRHDRVIPARRPSRCNSRGAGCAPRQPHRTRRAFPARTGAPFPGTGIASRRWCRCRSRRLPPGICRPTGSAGPAAGSARFRSGADRLGGV